jgi:hypothetical protein
MENMKTFSQWCCHLYTGGVAIAASEHAEAAEPLQA